MYDANGERVARRRLRYAEGRNASIPPPCGMLVDLTKVGRLFDRFEYAPEDDATRRPGKGRVLLTTFPMASTRTYGHVQAERGVPVCISRVLDEINSNVRRRAPGDVDHDEEESDDDEEDYDYNPTDRQHPPVQGVQCQIYNVFSHRIRPKGARFHDAQQGYLTQYAAGTHAINDRGKNTFARITKSTDRFYPPKVFAMHVKAPGVPVDLRVENVFLIRPQRMRKRLRNGW